MRGEWVVVVPVRDAAAGKTRLAGALDDSARVALVRAMALDTIAAAGACPEVGQVVVVTSDDVVWHEAPVLGVGADAKGGAGRIVMVPEPAHDGARSGLEAAAAAGVAVGRAGTPGASVGVLLGDLPALRSGDLAAGLASAARYGRAFVADAAGTGTTLLAVAPGVPFESRFGMGSAAAHAALGYVRLDVPDSSTLRHDVDLPVDLDVVRALRPGPRTAALLDGLTTGAGSVARDGAARCRGAERGS